MRPAAILLATLAAGTAGASHAAEIKVLGGSAVIPVMEVLVPQFERSTGHRVVADFDGAIGAMSKRVAAGERADVAIVSREQIEALEKQGKTLAATAADLGRLGIGVFVRKGAPKPDIGTAEAFVRAIHGAKSIGYNDPAAGAPVSLYLLRAFEQLGIASEMKAKTVVFKQRSERFAAVARGDVELGFNQVSEILAAPGVDLVGPLPAALQNYTYFTAAVISTSASAEAARAFVAYISSPQTRDVWAAKGFEPASCIDAAADKEAFNECTQQEILPLESKVVHLVNAVRSRYRADPERLRTFERAADAWNAERNSRCSAQALGKDEMAAKRAFATCTKQALEARVRELEAL